MNLKVSEIAEMCGGRLVGSGENTVTSFYLNYCTALLMIVNYYKCDYSITSWHIEFTCILC